MVSGGDDGFFDVGDVFDVAGAANEVFDAIDGEVAGTDFAVRLAHGIGDVGEGYLVGAEQVGIDIDLVFFFKATDGGDFGDALGGEQGVAHLPVLNAAEFVGVPAADRLAVGVAAFEDIPKNLTETGGVWAEGGGGFIGQQPGRAMS